MCGAGDFRTRLAVCRHFPRWVVLFSSFYPIARGRAMRGADMRRPAGDRRAFIRRWKYAGWCADAASTTSRCAGGSRFV